MCEVKRNRRSTKSLSSFLAFLYIAIKHTGWKFIENIQNNWWLCILATHMSEAIFTSQLKNKEKMIDAADSKGVPFENIKHMSC